VSAALPFDGLRVQALTACQLGVLTERELRHNSPEERRLLWTHHMIFRQSVTAEEK